jgi:hypothetical protein
MKKIILIATIISGVTAYGQKGAWYIGGGAGFSSGTNDMGSLTAKRMSWSLSPEVGTFVTNHIQLGLGVTASGAKTTPGGGSSYESSQFGGTVYSRYLFGDMPFKPFAGINVSYMAGRADSFSGSGVNKSNMISASFNAGFAYYIAPRVSVFGSVGVLGYSNTRLSSTGFSDQVINDFGLNVNTLGNRFTIGMYYTFRPGNE